MEVYILAKLDKVTYGTWITPFSLLALPYTIIVMTAFFFAPTLGLVSLYVESVLVWIVGLFLFWLGGLTIVLSIGKTIRFRPKVNQLFLFEKESEKLVLILAWVTIFLMSYKLFISIGSLGWQQIGTDDFAYLYGYGWIGHISTFSMGLTIFLIGTARRKRVFCFITIIILMLLYLMYPVKSWVFIPLLAGLIYRIVSGRFIVSIYQMMFFLLTVYILFNMSYMVEFGVINIGDLFNVGTYESLLRHFVSYMFSGVLTMGETLQMGINNLDGDPYSIFSPFVNLYYVIFSGKLHNPIPEHYAVISLDGTTTSNVNTLFGTILINLGYFQSIIFVFFLGSIIYGIYIIAKITRNSWAEIIFSFIGAMLLLGWFEYYFWHLPSIEFPFYFAIFGFLLSLFGRRNKESNYSESLLQ